MIRSAFFMVVAGGVVFSGIAQNRYVGAFLRTTADDSALVAQSKHAVVLQKSLQFMPVIGDAEFRIRNRAWDIPGQRYSLKVTPRGIGESRSIKKYNNAQIACEEEKNSYLFNDKLLQRYIAIIDLLEKKMVLDSYNDLITLYEDRITVMDQLKNSTSFQLGDLIKAEKDLSKLAVQKIEEAQEIANVNRVIGTLLGVSPFTGFDTTGLIHVSSIKKILDKTTFNVDENNVALKYMKRQFELADSRFNYEKARNRQLLSFVEFSYDNGTMIEETDRRDARKSFDLNQAFMVELGFKIPFLSGGDEDLARRNISYLEDKDEYEQIRRELIAKMSKDTSDIRALISQFEYLSARETEVDAEASLKKYLQMSGVDPLALLDIKENLVKNGVEKATIFYSILRNFVYVLDGAGQLSQKPMKNYLFENLETVDR